LNIYSFSKSNPISFYDPDGAFPVYITIERTIADINGGIKGQFTVETPSGFMSGYTLERPYRGDVLARTADSGSSIMAGEYIGMRAYNVLTVMVNTIRLSNPDLLGNRTGSYLHNGNSIKDSEDCILVGGDPTLSVGRRQEIFDFIAAAEQTQMASNVAMVMLGFYSLISIGDFPEITVTVNWASWFLKGQAELVSWQNETGILAYIRSRS